MDEVRKFIIRFEGIEQAEANLAAMDLKAALEEVAGPEEVISIVKETKNTLDFGATIALVLGAPAAVAIAQGIAAYLRNRNDGSTVCIIKVDGNEVVATGKAAESLDVERVAAALRGETDVSKKGKVARKR
ncbi:hypothetical protein WME89_31685 [Sorangium sp. So ce321]|uniref:effector-associated constant component EACC1 n=1 Tax=Sorangium sp. So ce321 TaxID=3133300 RepID=UPI003F5E5A81